jgi:hypothetical protein
MPFLVAMPADARRSFGPSLEDELAVKQAAILVSSPASTRGATPRQCLSPPRKQPAPRLGRSDLGGATV